MASTDDENADLRRQIERLEHEIKLLKRETSAEDRDGMQDVQHRADSIAALFGERVSAPSVGETLADYRRRLLEKFKKHSPEFKNTQMAALHDNAIPLVEKQVYADAERTARTTATAPGKLISRTERVNGRDITTFAGDNGVWMAPFMRPGNVGKVSQTMADAGAYTAANIRNGRPAR